MYKIISWNCNGGFRNKIDTFQNIDFDILIIQECENPNKIKNLSCLGVDTYYWIGNNQNKGLAVFIKPNLKVRKLHWENGGFDLFLPLQIENDITIVAVWTLGTKNHHQPYVGQALGYININKQYIQDTANCILIGDFNSNKIWDKKHRNYSHSLMVSLLEGFGIKSVYHHLYNEPQGEEKSPTFFLYRKPERPYYIDYVFSHLNRSVKLEIGKVNQWLQYSDHLPLFFEISRR